MRVKCARTGSKPESKTARIIDAPFIRLNESSSARVESTRCNFLCELRKYDVSIAFIHRYVATASRANYTPRHRRKSEFLLVLSAISVFAMINTLIINSPLYIDDRVFTMFKSDLTWKFYSFTLSTDSKRTSERN